MNENPYEIPASFNLGRPQSPQQFADIPATRSRRFKSILIAVSVWQFTPLVLAYCLSMYLEAPHKPYFSSRIGWLDYFIKWLVFSIVILLPTNAVTIATVNKLFARTGTRARKILRVCYWQMITMLALVISVEFDFAHTIYQICWLHFGLSTDRYVFDIIPIHRYLSWLLCTIPTVWILVWIDAESKLDRALAKWPPIKLPLNARNHRDTERSEEKKYATGATQRSPPP